MKDKRFWVVLSVFVVYSLFFWPTPYTYLENSQGWHVRVNRLTGDPQIWIRGSWQSLAALSKEDQKNNPYLTYQIIGAKE
ncbi:hypothetical protein [Armatimonas sp.]|uniref:hypothetical protein n=1 Tax=Armatimonas sp. TaxID=1872638 RepID=UPI0037517FFF